MKKSILIYCFLLMLCSSLFAQNPVSSRSTSLGGTGLTFNDANSLFTNQAGIAKLDTVGVILSSEQRFRLSELSTYSLGLALPTKAGVFGIAVNYFGFDAFNQQKYGLIYARQLLENFSIGAEFNVHSYQFAENGSLSTVSVEVGLQYVINDELSFGVQIANPVTRTLVNDETLAAQIQAGLMYQPSNKVRLLAEVDKKIDTNPNLRIGIEYQIIDILYLRAGTSTDPSQLSFGLGFSFDSGLKIDFASSFHRQLGWTPGISFIHQKG